MFSEGPGCWRNHSKKIKTKHTRVHCVIFQKVQLANERIVLKIVFFFFFLVKVPLKAATCEHLKKEKRFQSSPMQIYTQGHIQNMYVSSLGSPSNESVQALQKKKKKKKAAVLSLRVTSATAFRVGEKKL